MAEFVGRKERGPGEGHPEEEREKGLKETLEAKGIDVGSEDFDWITGEAPHVGPTAGGG